LNGTENSTNLKKNQETKTGSYGRDKMEARDRKTKKEITITKTRKKK